MKLNSLTKVVAESFVVVRKQVFTLLAFLLTCLIWVQCCVSLASGQVSASANAVPVEVVQTADGGWQLLRRGQPYYVRGGGGAEASLKALAAAGANSSRIWGVGDQTRARLDDAHRNGLTVAVGIWLEHERHEKIDYSDAAQVEEQAQLVLEAVRSLKDHPAVLVWGLGNEMEGDGNNEAIWKHIEDLAKRVKAIDPHHPTMTVIAEMGEHKIPAIHRLCPSLDLIGINAYGGAASVPRRYQEKGGTKPYLVTEFGPVGTWETQKDHVGAIREATGAEKSKMYRDAYQAFQKDKQQCLGSYAFMWGNKQEGTATWFGLLLPDGKRTAAADTMAQLWSGREPVNRCPVIEQMVLVGKQAVEPGATVKVKLEVSDPDGDPIGEVVNVRWVVTPEARAYVTGGDFQKSPAELKECVVEAGPKAATIKLPTREGLFRIYAYAEDEKHLNAATANLTVSVCKPGFEDVVAANLPFVLYDEPSQALASQMPTYAPSGYMGQTKSLTIDPKCQIAPKSGKFCLRVTHGDLKDWGGVAWQHPANDWGELPGGLRLTGAKELTFWAKGKSGGEKVKFGFGLLDRSKAHFDTAKHETDCELTSDWKEYSIPCENLDLSRIKTGFFWSAAVDREPVEFFLDQISYR